MPEGQYKRNIAYKYRIGDLLLGKPAFDGERFSFLELGDRKIARVNIIGNIIDKYESEGERKYIFFTLDDGSGQIKLKCFAEDANRFRNVTQGQTVLVIGSLRNFNNETYISPEIIREQDTKYLLIRKMEIEKEKSKISIPLQREQIIAVKDKILNIIKNAEKDGGIEMDKIIMDLREVSPEIINQEIKKLLEEGIIFKKYENSRFNNRKYRRRNNGS
jgi:RPA family protein